MILNVLCVMWRVTSSITARAVAIVLCVRKCKWKNS